MAAMNLAIATGVGSTLYRVLLLAHILLAIVGFGGVLLNGVYLAKAKQRSGAQATAISQANYEVSAIAEYAIFAVPISGICLVWASGKAWSFADTWVWLSLAITLIALVVARTVLMSGHHRLNILLAASEQGDKTSEAPNLVEIERLRKIQGMAGGVLAIATIALLVLMIWKPTS